MAADEKWYFTKEELANTPSTKCGYDADRELSCRQQAAHLIQDMGQRLQVSQLCINTAMVYMHRFYVFHSFTHFNLDAMAAAALFLAAKVEEQPRKLEHVIRVKQICAHREHPPLDVKSEQYIEQAQDLVFNENVLLQTLGFDVAIDHPHTHVVRCCHLVRATKDLAQTSYFMASNSLHLTTMCLQYKPTVVACFCIHLACKWSNWEIPQSNEGKYWFYYVDKTVTQDLLQQLTEEFLVIFEKCPSRLKKKIKSANQNASSFQFEKMTQRDAVHDGVTFQSHHRPQDPNRPSSSQQAQSSSSRDNQEKRERERQMASQGASTQHREGHHRSHHVGHPHPTSASALLKPHAGVSSNSKVPHPGPHRSSLPHHSRGDHHARPDHQQRPEHPQRADFQQRQDRQARPEHAVRPDHHPRSDHPGRPEQMRSDPHQVRPEHQQRGEHQSRVDHSQRYDHHTRPDQQVRTDHQGRTDHVGSQVRSDSQQRLEQSNRSDSALRPDQPARQEHTLRSDHQSAPDRHDRPDSNERLMHADQRHSGVTAARDQLRREAALQREASRRETFTLPSNLMNHSPAQRTSSADSAISSGSLSSLTSGQEWSSFGSSSAVSGGNTSLKHMGPSELSHRHSSSNYEKVKASNSSMDQYTRHKNSITGTDRRLLNSSSSGVTGSSNSSNIGIVATGSSSGGPKDVPSGKQPSVPYNNQQHASGRHRRPHENLLNATSMNRDECSNSSVSLDRKMMQEISERRQLESFFGKTEALERMNEKQQGKPSVPYMDVKKEHDTTLALSQHQQPAVSNSTYIKREKVSPSRQSSSMGPPSRVDSELPTSLHMMHPSYKLTPSQYSTSKIKTEPDSDPSSDAQNGTAIPSLLIPKVEKIDVEIKGENSSIASNRLPPVKGSIFSPEKTLPRERELPVMQRSAKISCPPSPGIAFGSPPVTPGKAQGSSNRNRTNSENESSVEHFKIEKESGFENMIRENRVDVKNSSLGSHHVDNFAQMTSRNLDQRHVSVVPKIEPKSAHLAPNKSSSSHDLKNLPQQQSTYSISTLQGRTLSNILDERQSTPYSQVSTMPDVRSAVQVKSTDVRTTMPTPIEGDLGAVAFPASESKDLLTAPISEEGTSADNHHHKSKKKKEKKEKHKHKDKDKEKHREEKKHKSKHKEKDKERRKSEAATSDLVQTLSQNKPGITIKIPKANITPPPIPAVAAPSSSGSLKLKINLAGISSTSTSSASAKESRKRERDKSSPGPEASHPKAPKLSTSIDTSKRGANVSGLSHSGSSSKSNFARQNGLESRGGVRHHMQQSQHYSGSKMLLDGSSSKPSEMSKNSSSHSSTS